MNRLLCCTLLLATFVVIPLSSLAAPPGAVDDPPLSVAGEAPDDESPGGRHFERLATILDLSAEQRRQIDGLRAAERQATEPYRRQVQASRQAIHELTRHEPFDEGAVRRLARDKADAAVELQVARARTRNQVQALLTTEQRALAERLEMGPGRRGAGRPGRDRR